MLELHNKQGGEIMTEAMNSNYHSFHMIELVKERQRLDGFLVNKSNINYRDNEHKNALYWAIKNRSIYNISLLIEHKISLMVTPKTHALFYALDSNNIEGLLFLIQRKIDINTQNSQGKTPLMVALEKECIVSVQYLLAFGADLYIMDDNHDMAMDYAKRCKNKKVFELVYYKEVYEKSKEIEKDCTGCPIAQQSLCSVPKEF